jgi:hypothetical protein
VASLQLLLLVALNYGIAHIVSASISFASQAKEEPHSSTLALGSVSNLHAELVCESTAPRLSEHSACNPVK